LRIKVAVFFGGRSAEHAISCQSARSVVAELARTPHEVHIVAITTDGRWKLVERDWLLEGRGHARSIDARADRGVDVVLHGRSLVALDNAGRAETVGDIDVAFPVMHGLQGEDGTLQGLFELVGLPYVGSGVLSSAVCLDKDISKRLLRAARIRVTDHLVVDGQGGVSSASLGGALDLPVFVKPARGGSSIGVARVDRWDDLEAAVAGARAFDRKVVVEAAVSGREISCGVLESSDGLHLSEVGEPIFAGNPWYDHRAKYEDPTCKVVSPAAVAAAVRDRIWELATNTFTALACRGLARVDVFVGPTGVLTLNEVNTMPGLAADSLFIKMWAATGVPPQALMRGLVEDASALADAAR